MTRSLAFVSIFVAHATVVVALLGGGAWVLVPPLVTFGLIPLLDGWIGLNRDNRADPAAARLLRLLPQLFVPAHLLLLGVVLHRVTTDGTLWEKLGWVGGMGIAGGIAITVAHELMHRPTAREQRLAEVLMASTTYTHFCVEHVWGHHKNVATPADPATSRRGESLYAFLPRTLVGSLASAWRIEAARARQSGRSPYGPANRLVGYAVAQVLLLAALGAWLGPVGVAAFLGQSAVAVGLLETINYVEHYGLTRPASAEGRYGRVLPEHSWNASHLVSNAMLLNLARHSDHHAFVARAYPELRHHEDVPQLPYGYATMVLVALVPPLWFRIMEPRVEALRAAA